MELPEYTEYLVSILDSFGLSQSEIAYRTKNLHLAEIGHSSISPVSDRYYNLAHEIKSFEFLKNFGAIYISCDNVSESGCDTVLSGKYYIECVCASAGDSGKNGLDKFAVVNTLGGIIDYSEKEPLIMVRLTSSLKEKKDFYYSHVEKSIPSDKPYIVFLGLGSLAVEMYSEENGFALTRILLGRGNPQYKINTKTKEVIENTYAHNEEILKWNGSPIDCNLFYNEEYACISGIIFTDADLFEPYCFQNTRLFINPFAKNPISLTDFKQLVVWSTDDEGMYSSTTI